MEWPVGETLEGPGRRYFGRIRELITAFESCVLDRAVVYAPKEGMSSGEETRTSFYRSQFRLPVEAQAKLLEDWTLDTCVPEFDVVRAAGVPGHWNYLQLGKNIDRQEAGVHPAIEAW